MTAVLQPINHSGRVCRTTLGQTAALTVSLPAAKKIDVRKFLMTDAGRRAIEA
jgi:hypothetical protein